jgi:transcriptional regulator with XRE-family HTH domain
MCYTGQIMDSNHSPRAIAQRMKTAREEAGFSQEELGRKIGLTKVAYGDYERVKRLFDTDQLFQLSRILGRPVEYFLGLETNLTDDEGQLLALYRSIDSQQAKEIVMATVRQAAS